MNKEFRPIPGYSGYSVTSDGKIRLDRRSRLINPSLFNGYEIVTVSGDCRTRTLPVHRAVALAWIDNPEQKPTVNHKDGNPLNNIHTNLEWVSVGENNEHAINNDLRNDNIPCKLRNVFTGEVTHFKSFAQASLYMGCQQCLPWEALNPREFGALVKDKFEFRLEDDPRPWFYETRNLLPNPSRYKVIVTDDRENVVELFSQRDLLKRFQLYDAPSKSIPGLVDHGNKKYPYLSFQYEHCMDADLDQIRTRRNTRPSIRTCVRAEKMGKKIEFRSLTECANHFNVDRSTILNRLDTDKTLDGWIFVNQAAPISDGGVQFS